MRLIKIAELPYVSFGRDICREIRLEIGRAHV